MLAESSPLSNLSTDGHRAMTNTVMAGADGDPTGSGASLYAASFGAAGASIATPAAAPAGLSPAAEASFSGSVSTGPVTPGPVTPGPVSTESTASGPTSPPLSLEDEVKALRKENRKLQRELSTANTQLATTNELYVTSERVLTRAYKDLETAASRYRDMQDQLERTARLATIGELAARVVHEVLNPMTSLLGRLQSMIHRIEQQGDSSPLSLMNDILQDWKSIQAEESMAEHLSTPGESGMTLFEEDLDDIQTLLTNLVQQNRTTLEDMRFLERTCMHTVRIVNNMRALSRTRNELSYLDVQKLLMDSLELQRDQLRRNAIEVKEHYVLSLPEVYTDPSEMIQVFTNLIRNAQQAIGRGGTIQISTRSTAERVEVRIRDNGSGIQLPSEELEKLFEGGYTTRSRQEGTGLGLAISRRVARKYHGDLLVEWTVPGEGTCFLLWLPQQVEKTAIEQALKTEGAA